MGSERATRTYSRGGVKIQAQTKVEDALISAFILAVPIVMSIFSPPTFYRALPLVFGISASVGYLLKSFLIFDTGIFLTIISYLFANAGIPFNVYNLFRVMIFFFLILIIWFDVRNLMFKSGIEKSSDTKGPLSAYRRSSLRDILNTLLMGFFLSMIASFLVLYSSLGITLGYLFDLLLMVALSTAVFFITFLIIKLLSSQKIDIGLES